MISVRLNNLSLKYQKFILSGCKDIGTEKFEFVTKTEFLSQLLKYLNYNMQLKTLKRSLKSTKYFKLFSNYHLEIKKMKKIRTLNLYF